MKWFAALLSCVLVMPLSAQTVKLDSTRIDSVPVTVWSKSTTKWYTKIVVQLDTVHIPLPSAKLPSVLVGQWGPVPDSILPVYTGTLITGMEGYKQLEKVRAARSRAVLYLPRNAMRDSIINVAEARAYIAALPDLASYIADSTLWGFMVADDITGKDIWGACASSGCLAQFDSVAQAVKARWPSARTIVRSAPTVVSRWPYKMKWIGWTWAQYSARYGSAVTYRDTELAASKVLGKCNVFGINTVNGGDGSSGVGSIPRAEMSAAEVLTLGKLFLPYTPIFLNWEYRESIEQRIGPALRQVQAIADTTTLKVTCA
jgi:hypothetical protein